MKMAEDYLFCNYKNCKAPITKFIWVTRCSHVFCEAHGNSYFLNESPKVKCPACNETNTKETDVIKSNLNPHDLLLSCVRPEKVLDYVINSSKLWTYQMNQKRKFSISLLSNKYEKIASDSLSKLRAENIEMKKFIMEVEERLKNVNEELLHTKKRLWKYKMAYKNSCLRNQQMPQPQENPINQSFFSELSEEMANNEVADLFKCGKSRNVGHVLTP